MVLERYCEMFPDLKIASWLAFEYLIINEAGLKHEILKKALYVYVCVYSLVKVLRIKL